MHGVQQNFDKRGSERLRPLATDCVRFPRLPRGLPAPSRHLPFSIDALLLISALSFIRRSATRPSLCSAVLRRALSLARLPGT